MDDFARHVADQFAGFGAVEPRRMFGGHGLFHDGLMFAIVADDVLYLKVDRENVEDFQSRGLSPFGYVSRGRRVTMSYYQAPAEILEDPLEAVAWARRAYDAALRAKATRPGRGRGRS